MKKEIFLHEHIKELSPEAYKKLKSFIENMDDNPKLYTGGMNIEGVELSIADMIDLIEKSKPEWRGITMYHSPGGDMDFPEWNVSGNYSNGDKNWHQEKELCDVLWETVKDILQS